MHGGRIPHTRGDRRGERPVNGTLLVRRVGYRPLHRGAPVVTEVVQQRDASPPGAAGKKYTPGAAPQAPAPAAGDGEAHAMNHSG